MKMENEWEIRAVALLSRLGNEDEAEVVLNGGREGERYGVESGFGGAA